jgi:hypothetical protein
MRALEWRGGGWAGGGGGGAEDDGAGSEARRGAEVERCCVDGVFGGEISFRRAEWGNCCSVEHDRGGRDLDCGDERRVVQRRQRERAGAASISVERYGTQYVDGSIEVK